MQNHEVHKQTPFAFHKDSSIRFDNIKPAKGLQNIRSLFEKRMIKEPESAVLDAINTYGYLNAFLIRLLVEQRMECTQSFCKELLAKMVKLGLLCRFRIVYNDIDKKEHASSYIYTFSERGRKLFGRQKESMEEIDSLDVLTTLAFNQFYIMTKHTYRDALTNAVYCNKNDVMPYDGRIQFLSNGKAVRLDVLTIRQNEQWEKEFLKKLKKQITYTATKSSAVLVLCETELQALSAERARKSVKELNEIEICYLCDFSTCSGKPTLEQLIRVNAESDYSSYEVCVLPVDGTIRPTESMSKEDSI